MAFAEIEKVAPYLVRSELDEGIVQIASTDRDVRVVGFRPKVGPAPVRIVVAVNDNVTNRRTFQLQHTQGASAVIVDLATGTDVTATSKTCKLDLAAGTGKVFAIGTPADVRQFQTACVPAAKQ